MKVLFIAARLKPPTSDFKPCTNTGAIDILNDGFLDSMEIAFDIKGKISRGKDEKITMSAKKLKCNIFEWNSFLL